MDWKNIDDDDDEKDTLKEYCGFETFRPKCLGNEVIVMDAAVYGRRKIGRCVQASDFEELGEKSRFIGCYTDVISLVDARCSGRKDCEIRIPDSVLQQATTCPLPSLLTYMEASYSCVEVVAEDRSCVVSATSTPLHIAARSNVSSLSSHHRTSTGPIQCGTKAQPWILEAPTGQKIRLSLLDFPTVIPDAAGIRESTKVVRTDGGQQRGAVSGCVDQRGSRLYGYIIDNPATGNKRNVSMCAGAGSQRLANVYTSTSNTLELVLVSPDQYVVNFLLRLEAVGCTDLVPPDDAWIKREDETLVIGCYLSRQTWQLRCQDGRWIGVVSNCTRHSDVALGGEFAGLPIPVMTVGNHEVVAVVAISFGGLAICLIIVCCAIVCLQRFYSKDVYKRQLFTDQREHVQRLHPDHVDQHQHLAKLSTDMHRTSHPQFVHT